MVKICTLDKFLEDFEFILTEYAIKSTKITEAGKVSVYRCKLHECCPYLVKKLEPANAETEQLFFNGENHSEILVEKSDYHQSFEAAKELYLRGFQTPLRINTQLRLESRQEIPTTKLGNILKKIRLELESAPTISIGEMKKFCQENAPHLLPPHDINELDWPTVQKFFINESGELVFRIMFSSKRLLQLLTTAQNINIDGTYKLNYNGFPLIVIGTSDDARVSTNLIFFKVF